MKYSTFIVLFIISYAAGASSAIGNSGKLSGCTVIQAFDDCFFKSECSPRVNQLIYESGEGGYLNTRLHRDKDDDKSYFYDVSTRQKVSEFGRRWVDKSAKGYVYRANRYSLVYYVNGGYRDGARVCG